MTPTTIPAPGSDIQGRPLDAAVAEKVMGWTRHPEKMHPTDNRTIGGVLYCPPGHPCDAGGVNVVPSYSTSISAAWQIVDHLQAAGNMVSINASTRQGDWWCVVYLNADCGGYVESDYYPSAPLAICNAALLAAEKLKERAA